MEEHNDHHMVLIAIIAIVAIVAIIAVVLILNTGNRNQSGSAYSFEVCVEIVGYCNGMSGGSEPCYDASNNRITCPQDGIDTCYKSARDCFGHLFSKTSFSAK